MPEPRVIPRSVQAEIVADLAKGHRSISAIAGRHHIPSDLVVLLRDKYGPELPKLIEAAKELRRPALRGAAPAASALAEASSEPAPPKTWKRYQDGLTGDERRACRAWAGLPITAHPVPKDTLAHWDAAGRPMPDASAWDTPAVVAAVEAPAVAASHQTPAPEIGGEADPAPASACDEITAEVTPSEPVEDPEGEPQAELEPTPDAAADDDVVDATIWCSCGAAPDGECRACRDDSAHAIGLDGRCRVCDGDVDGSALDWDRFYRECLAIPALADHCRAVADAVERLRDARAEYEHREGLVSRIAQVIDDGLGYQEADDIARAVLDLIEAA